MTQAPKEDKGGRQGEAAGGWQPGSSLPQPRPESTTGSCRPQERDKMKAKLTRSGRRGFWGHTHAHRALSLGPTSLPQVGRMAQPARG